MADYNSAHTGTAIDQAIVDTAEIGYYYKLFTSATGVTGPINLNAYDSNPSSGDIDGLYYVQYKNTGNEERSVGFIYVEDPTKDYCGAGHCDIVSGTMYASTIRYAGVNTSIVATYDDWNFAGGSGNENTELTIFGIWRFQHLR